MKVTRIKPSRKGFEKLMPLKSICRRTSPWNSKIFYRLALSNRIDSSHADYTIIQFLSAADESLNSTKPLPKNQAYLKFKKVWNVTIVKSDQIPTSNKIN